MKHTETLVAAIMDGDSSEATEIEFIADVLPEQYEDAKALLHAVIGLDHRTFVSAMTTEQLLRYEDVDNVKDWIEEKVPANDPWWRDRYQEDNEICLPAQTKESIYTPQIRSAINEIEQRHGAQFLYNILEPHLLMGHTNNY